MIHAVPLLTQPTRTTTAERKVAALEARSQTNTLLHAKAAKGAGARFPAPLEPVPEGSGERSPSTLELGPTPRSCGM